MNVYHAVPLLLAALPFVRLASDSTIQRSVPEWTIAQPVTVPAPVPAQVAPTVPLAPPVPGMLQNDDDRCAAEEKRVADEIGKMPLDFEITSRNANAQVGDVRRDQINGRVRQQLVDRSKSFPNWALLPKEHSHYGTGVRTRTDVIQTTGLEAVGAWYRSSFGRDAPRTSAGRFDPLALNMIEFARQELPSYSATLACQSDPTKVPRRIELSLQPLHIIRRQAGMTMRYRYQYAIKVTSFGPLVAMTP